MGKILGHIKACECWLTGVAIGFGYKEIFIGELYIKLAVSYVKSVLNTAHTSKLLKDNFTDTDGNSSSQDPCCFRAGLW